MIPYWQDNLVQLYCGDCREVVKSLADCSVDSIVTDPPAGISFMGKDWDHNKGGRDAWVAWLTNVMRECLRVLKPGGHALVWALPRTSHWTGWAIESAGFEVRDRVSHLFGSGFPKSLDVSKAIDAAAGVEREIVGPKMRPDGKTAIACRPNGFPGEHEGWDRPWKHDQAKVELQTSITAPATDAARQWSGWGTALKPACEDWWLCRKSLEGTVAENVLRHGTGGLNIDGCRIGDDERLNLSASHNQIYGQFKGAETEGRIALGRWPSHIIHDGSEEVLAGFPDTTVGTFSGHRNELKTKNTFGEFSLQDERSHVGSSGSAARFFYCSKTSQVDRNKGLDDLPLRSAGEVTDRRDGSAGLDSPRAGAGRTSGSRNFHPTVKPTRLMRYLCRLITPPNGVILDPFCGSGSTGKAAVLEGFQAILIDISPDYCELAKHRIQEPPSLFNERTVEVVEPEPDGQVGLFAETDMQ